MTNRIFRLAQNILLAVCAIAFTLLLAELLTRIFLPEWQPRRAVRAQFWQYHAVLGWSLRPGAQGRFVGPSWDVEVKINEKGLRDIDHDYQKTSARRILVLGDSFAWGYGVEQNRTVTALLRESCPDWEFINAGVSGYATDQEYLYYREEGHRYAPDEVLIMFYSNDLLENSCAQMYGYPKPHFVVEDGELALRNVPVPGQSIGQRLYSFLSSRSFITGRILSMTKLTALFDRGCSKIDVELNQRILRKFSRELSREGVARRLVFIPTYHSKPESLADSYRPFAKSEGIRLLDLGPAFIREASAGRELVLEEDSHWNEAGHRLAADTIAADLRCSR